jgi:group I intron endonuclease
MTMGIYTITNRINGKRYVGSAIDITERVKTHKRELRAGRHVNKGLQHDWKLHGEEAFLFEVVRESEYEELWDDEYAVFLQLKPEYNARSPKAAVPQKNRIYNVAGRKNNTNTKTVRHIPPLPH